jgi:hypothetical protein
MTRRLRTLTIVFGLGSLLIGVGCGHQALTTITTRENGTIKLCGKFKESETLVTGKTPEGSRISVNRADIVMLDTNGVCRK